VNLPTPPAQPVECFRSCEYWEKFIAALRGTKIADVWYEYKTGLPPKPASARRPEPPPPVKEEEKSS
jgi:hypothetical protein